MNGSDDRGSLDPAAVRQRIDLELGEVRAAILLVSHGAASRVRVAGLSFGDVVRARLEDEAAREHVTLSPDYGPGDEGCDLAVVAAHDG